ncbi:MAG: hypothetical protein QGI51_07065, partial [Dehalococcoidales bacterium]|nr:hypothetical protein [Dehalococcoidales bacterium]
AIMIGNALGIMLKFSNILAYGILVRATKYAIVIPKITENTAVNKANIREFKNKTGSVAGISIVTALVQFSKVKCPSLAIGDADQKLPKTKKRMGTNINKPIIAVITV